MSDNLLEKCLSVSVPMWVLEHQNKTIKWLMYRKDHIKVPKEFRTHGEEIRSISSLIGERGDNLLYRGKKTGEAAFLLNTLAEGLAILSMVCKGGVTFGNLHFENPHKDLNSCENL